MKEPLQLRVGEPESDDEAEIGDEGRSGSERLRLSMLANGGEM